MSAHTYSVGEPWFAGHGRRRMRMGEPGAPGQGGHGGRRRGRSGRPWEGRPEPPWDRRGGFGPGFRGRGRKAARGDVRASVLALLAEQPMHGYQIISELAERSNGAWRPSPGSVYPVLQQLQDEGLVRVEETDGRRVVHLTDAGREYVEQHADELTAPWEAVGAAHSTQTMDLMTSVRAVTGAAWQVAQAGTDAQQEQAARLLGETRRNLYLILAEDPAGGDDPAGGEAGSEVRSGDDESTADQE